MNPETKKYYSSRQGTNRNTSGFAFDKIRELFVEIYAEMRKDGFFDQHLGWVCVDEGEIPGLVQNPRLDILLKTRSDNLWPVDERYLWYNEYDLFDVIEYLFTCVSKPTKGNYHSFSNCGMHWDEFDISEGQRIYVSRVNEVIALYCEPFELSSTGEVLRGGDRGFEPIFAAETPSDDNNVTSKVDAAILRYRRYGASLEERRLAVRDLADVLEYLRPSIKQALLKKDESDLFNIVNNFGIRHHNTQQQTEYDSSIWISWMFYVYLSTIHAVLRMIKKQPK